MRPPPHPVLEAALAALRLLHEDPKKRQVLQEVGRLYHEGIPGAPKGVVPLSAVYAFMAHEGVAPGFAADFTTLGSLLGSMWGSLRSPRPWRPEPPPWRASSPCPSRCGLTGGAGGEGEGPPPRFPLRAYTFFAIYFAHDRSRPPDPERAVAGGQEGRGPDREGPFWPSTTPNGASPPRRSPGSSPTPPPGPGNGVAL